MCGEDHDGKPKNDENWDGWVDGELVAPKGPIPADWPSSDDLGKLLVRNTVQQRSMQEMYSPLCQLFPH